jgi:hypothetical protein
MWGLIIVGVLCILVGVMFIVTDWVTFEDESDNNNNRGVAIRTLSEMQSNIKAYFVGRDIVDFATWPSITGDYNVAVNPTYHTVETHAKSGNSYMNILGNGNFGTWFRLSTYIPIETLNVNNGVTFMMAFRYEQTWSPESNAPIVFWNWQMYYNQTYWGVNGLRIQNGWNGGAFSMVPDTDYVMALSVSDNTADMIFAAYIYDTEGVLVASVVETLAGTAGMEHPNQNGWWGCGRVAESCPFYGQMFMDGYCTEEECQLLVQDMLNQTYRPKLTFDSITMYETFAVDRTGTLKGEVSTYSATGVPGGMSFDDATRRLHGAPASIGSGDITINIGGYDGNDVTVSYSVLPKPMAVYPETFTASVGDEIVILPTIQSVQSIDGITGILPEGLSLLLEETDGHPAGSIVGVPSTAVVTNPYVVQVTLPSVPETDETLTLKDSNVEFRLNIIAPVLNIETELFDYGTTIDKPLVCYEGIMDRVFGKDQVRSFIPLNNADFYQYQAVLPTNMKVNYETGAIEGVPAESLSTAPFSVYATHRVNGLQYHATLFIRIVKNMSTLEYSQSYVVPQDSDMVIEPTTVQGEALDIQLGTQWPSDTQADVSGVITIPQSSLPTEDLTGDVVATAVDRVIETRVNLITKDSASSASSQTKYLVGGGLCTLGTGLTSYGAYRQFFFKG